MEGQSVHGRGGPGLALLTSNVPLDQVADTSVAEGPVQVSREDGLRRIGVEINIAVGLILLLLFMTFKSIRLALLVITNLPFALIGGVFALYIYVIPIAVRSLSA